MISENMKAYTQQEKDFRLELSNILLKHNAIITIEDTEVVDYSDIPGFGNIYKKTIEVSISIDGEGVFNNNVIFDLGTDIKAENVFNCHAKTVLPEVI